MLLKEHSLNILVFERSLACSAIQYGGAPLKYSYRAREVALPDGCNIYFYKDKKIKTITEQMFEND